MKVFVALLLITLSLFANAQTEIQLSELQSHVGDSVKVKGKISGVRYLESAKNTPTFINVGGAYPNQLLTIVIWGDVRKKMNYSPSDKKNVGGMAVVTGKVELYQNKPQIVIEDPSQLQIFVDEEIDIKDVPPIKQE